jgi:hypothetical protein
MKDKKSAFPFSYADGNARGMTLRDYFAGQALIGLIASPRRGTSNMGMCAKDAYGLADAMIEEGEKE